jgi:hypothetical protein
MKFSIGGILKGAAALAGTVHPGVAAAIGLVNEFLPEDKQLPETATGKDVDDAIEGLPPEAQRAIREKEIDLEIAREEGWTERYKAMTQADGQETRAHIVLQLTRVLCFEILAFTVLIIWRPEVLESDALCVVFGVLTATPATVIMNYFGNLRREHSQRQEAMGVAKKAGGLMKVLSAFR